MNNFISQNKSAFKKKKKRWKPKGRQLEKEIFAEIQSLFVGKTLARDELICGTFEISDTDAEFNELSVVKPELNNRLA